MVVPALGTRCLPHNTKGVGRSGPKLLSYIFTNEQRNISRVVDGNCPTNYKTDDTPSEAYTTRWETCRNFGNGWIIWEPRVSILHTFFDNFKVYSHDYNAIIVFKQVIWLVKIRTKWLCISLKTYMVSLNLRWTWREKDVLLFNSTHCWIT